MLNIKRIIEDVQEEIDYCEEIALQMHQRIITCKEFIKGLQTWPKRDELAEQYIDRLEERAAKLRDDYVENSKMRLKP